MLQDCLEAWECRKEDWGPTNFETAAVAAARSLGNVVVVAAAAVVHDGDGSLAAEFVPGLAVASTLAKPSCPVLLLLLPLDDEPPPMPEPEKELPQNRELETASVAAGRTEAGVAVLAVVNEKDEFVAAAAVNDRSQPALLDERHSPAYERCSGS